ncbi:MAG: DUF4270 domain-containing protein [Bacteroidales bacterium]|nr:DUF4270 domain-containing protein [Bacteroidales bacterium]MCF8389197.1 DUF4270 domain-containing protein [Bacteroidales bacterium]
MSYRSGLKSTGSVASKYIFAFFISGLVFFNSCNEDPGFLGRDLLPPTDDLFTRFNDKTILTNIVSEAKPVATSANSTMLLGSKADSIFGRSKADFMTRFYIYPVTMGSERIIDSMVLSLKLTRIMGDVDYKPRIKIFELRDTLAYNSVFYSDTAADGFYNPAITLFDEEVDPLDTLINFKLSNADLFDRLTNAPDSVFSDALEFGDLFRGLYITSEDVTEGGSILYLNLVDADTGIKMYYKHEDDTTDKKVLNMFMNIYTPKVNMYSHDFTNSRATTFKDLPDQHDTLMFISSMAGLDTKINIEDFETWRNIDTLPVAINKAELVIPVADTLLTGESNDNYPSRLLLFSYDEDNVFDYLHDYRIDASGSYFGGYYDIENNNYVFNIGMHLQSYINGDIDNLNLILVSVSNSGAAERVILNSAYASDRKMELKITYTKF